MKRISEKGKKKMVGGKGGGEMEATTGGWGFIEDEEERDEQR